MKILLHDIVILYEKLLSQINVGQNSVVIFTGLDIDSLCTLKILSKLMKTENIEYKVYPTSTYTELQQRIEDSRCYEKVKLFFFINCGGLIDLTTKWFKDSFIFLFDVHKPIHHSNVEAENIKVIDDFQSDLDKVPTNYEAQLYFNMDEDFIEQLEEKPLEPEQQDEQDGIIFPKRKRHWNSQKIQKIRKHRQIITSKMTSYYGSNFFSLPSCYIAYKMIKDLNKSNNQYLWYAIVGTTGVYLEQKMSKQSFEAISVMYLSDMSKFNTNGIDSQIVFEKNSIRSKMDFQFPVMRQWSLYDSIMNSPYMVAKLTLWQQTGVNKLYQFLNQVGLSLPEAKQLFKYLSKQSVDKLQKQVLTCAQKTSFNLFDIAYNSFERQVDYCVEFMASDYYYAMTAKLEKSPKMKAVGEQLLSHRIKSFWQAYQLFEAKQTVLREAIEEYKIMAAIMTKQARNLVQRNHIMYGEVFSFVNFLSDSQQKKIFEHPFTLTKLAYMLMAMIKQKKKKKYLKPFIASLQNNETNTNMMVGVMAEAKNTFGVKFQKVIQRQNLDVTMNSFTANIMTISKENLIKVIQELGKQ